MQQFQVPQFIMIEDKIIGPLTLKQFFYLLGAAGVVVAGWFLLPWKFLFVLVALPVAGIFIALAFGTYDERPLPGIFASMINYFLKPRLYLWKSPPRQASPENAPKPNAPASPLENLPKLTESKLADLAWSLDIHERITREDTSGNKSVRP